MRFEVAEEEKIPLLAGALRKCGAPITASLVQVYAMHGLTPEELEAIADEGARICVALVNEELRAGYRQYHAPAKGDR
jgi:hypothetical protein